MQNSKKIIWIILDSVGIGALPDAERYGDAGSNTLTHIAEALPALQLPMLNGMGLYHLVPAFLEREKTNPDKPYYWARMAESSIGKDTITGHWEFTGIQTDEPFPTFPEGFPQELIAQLEQATGVSFLGNEVASGTEIIARLGAEHIRTGKPILYTSADSVLQIAAHEEIISVPELYRICECARNLTRTGPDKVGRVIARPFIGTEGAFVRTANRHDYALHVPENNLLHDLLNQHIPVYAIGKIGDIYAGTPFTKAEPSKSNDDGMEKTFGIMDEDFKGLCFVNLVDFDMVYGHRNDIDGYAAAATTFDKQLTTMVAKMKDTDILMITADHGCDPGFPGTDHSREYVPFLVYGKDVKAGVNLGTRDSFADIAATIQDIFEVEQKTAGNSFKDIILK